MIRSNLCSIAMAAAAAPVGGNLTMPGDLSTADLSNQSAGPGAGLRMRKLQNKCQHIFYTNKQQ